MFKKKPVVITAIQWDGNNLEEIETWIGRELRQQRSYDGKEVVYLLIPTLESPHEASRGDWIIKGIEGEFYPCKPDIFKKTYDEV